MVDHLWPENPAEMSDLLSLIVDDEDRKLFLDLLTGGIPDIMK